MISPLFEIIRFIINLIVLTIVLYVAGLIVVGGKRARFSDAFVIALLGTIISTFLIVFLPTITLITIGGQEITIGMGLSLILSFIAYLVLIRYYYETGWLGALAVAIVAVIVFVVASFIVGAVLLILLPFLA